MSMTSGNATVDAIGRMNITGNVVPLLWFKHLRLESGKTDSIAAILLAELVYWHRPTEERDETTGKVTGWRKRFAADKLQKSYGALADQFGFTKRQVTDAMHRLQSAGLITLEFRTLTVGDDKLVLNNVLFVSINPDAIARITYSDETLPLSRSNVIPIPLKRETNTETTTEIVARERVLSLAPQADATVPEPSPTPPPERVEPPIPKRKRKPRAPSEWESQRHALAEIFSAETDILPVVGYAELEKRWWSPLKAILAASKGDMERARTLIVLAVAQMRDRQFTISSPQSIEQAAIALSATTRASPQKRTIRVIDPQTGQPQVVEAMV